MAHDVPVTNSGVPHSARIWNYWLGGKDCYEIDQQVGEEIRRVNPEIVHVARAQRAFLARTVTYLTAVAGIRQFLDVGTGLPTLDNTHEVAQRIAPESRIVYVDHDPIVLAHATALLTSTPEGATDYLDADLREPESILQGAARTLDFGQPVALMLLGIAAHITDDGAYGIVRRLTDALPAGSHLVLCDSTEAYRPESMRAMVEQWNQASDNPRVNRTPEQIGRFFDGFEVLEPGLVSVSRWRPDPDEVTWEGGAHDDDGHEGEPPLVSSFGGVGRKV